MIKNDADINSLHWHYTLSPKYSLGIRHEYLRSESAHVDTIQINYLLKRWNQHASQANFYLKSGLGAAHDDGIEPAAFIGMATDWEDRRFFISYENRFFWADTINDYAKHKGRIGIAPYVGDYGDLHTWLMLQAEYDAGESEDKFSVTPLVRLFKKTSLLEAGYNLQKETLMFNFIQRF